MAEPLAGPDPDSHPDGNRHAAISVHAHTAARLHAHTDTDVDTDAHSGARCNTDARARRFADRNTLGHAHGDRHPSRTRRSNKVSKKTIPAEIQRQADEIVSNFNKKAYP
jgi:hypothetical protein